MCDVLERWGEYSVEWNARRGFQDLSEYVAVSRKHYRTQKPPMHLHPLFLSSPTFSLFI